MLSSRHLQCERLTKRPFSTQELSGNADRTDVEEGRYISFLLHSYHFHFIQQTLHRYHPPPPVPPHDCVIIVIVVIIGHREGAASGGVLIESGNCFFTRHPIPFPLLLLPMPGVDWYVWIAHHKGVFKGYIPLKIIDQDLSNLYDHSFSGKIATWQMTFRKHSIILNWHLLFRWKSSPCRPWP